MTSKADMHLLSLALDEIYELRRLCAYEASVREADLDYATYPKSRRKVAEDRIERLRKAACGHVDVAVAGTSSLSLRASFLAAGAKQTMTRSQWESEKPSLRKDV